MNAAERVVHLLIDGVGDSVEVEYHPASIDSMPHVTWMIRAMGADPTQYLAKGTAHDRDEAQRQVQEKVRLLGVRVKNVIDNTKGARPQ
jgi:hypothetical protein